MDETEHEKGDAEHGFVRNDVALWTLERMSML